MPTVSALPATSECEACGGPIPAGSDRCPECGQELSSGRLILVVVIVLLIALFALTQYVVRLHRQTESSLAQNWFSRGERAMKVGYPDIAAEDYRTALTYDRENDEYRLRLAQSLLAADHLNEARSHLRSLWEAEPADGEINLTLARLFAKEGNSSEAVRYYRNAINGVWRSDAREQRIAARFELVNYLLKRHDLRQAEAELIGLQADAPHDIEHQLELAAALLRIGDAARAQGVYEGVLRENRDNAQAWLGDGKASFAMGDYPAAEREFAAAVEHDGSLTEAQQGLKVTREVLRIAPGLRGLSIAERARRVSQAFSAALQRLTTCADSVGHKVTNPANSSTAEPHAAVTGSSSGPVVTTSPSPPTSLQMLYNDAMERRPGATERTLRNNPDALEPTMDFVFEVERATAPLCADMSDTDRALLILADRQPQTLR